MADSVSLIADEIVETVGGVGVDEAITDPLASADRLIDVGNDFESGFYTVFVGLASL